MDADSGMMEQAQYIWGMLDDMAQSDPQAYKAFIDKHVKEGKETMKPPEPHMCVKTTITPNKKRLYINICEWARIPEPKSPEAPIPVMGGSLYQQSDDSGAFQCVTLVFNPAVLSEFGIESTLMEEQKLLINLGLDYLQDQYKLQVSRSYVLLPISSRYKGRAELVKSSFLNRLSKTDEEDKFTQDLEELEKTFGPMTAGCKDSLLSQLSNVVVDEEQPFSKPPDINIELSTNKAKNKSKKLIEEVESTPAPPVTPEHHIRLRPGSTGQQRSVQVKICLPDISSVAECQLDIAKDEISLCVPGRYSLLLPLPELCSETDATAKYSKKSQTLTITLSTLQT